MNIAVLPDKLLLCITLLLAWGITADADARRINTLPCLQVVQGPAIDGDLDERCWRDAALATGFSTVGSGGYELASRQTIVRFVYDTESIYIAAVCFDSGEKEILARITDRDGSVFHDDCVELFFGVDADESTYFHYAINALGAYYDGRLKDGTWNSDITIAAQRHPDHWVFEAAIPFAALDTQMPQPGEVWSFNVARNHAVTEADLRPSTWSTLSTASFHVPQDFSQLRFVNRPVTKSLREVSNIKKKINPRFNPTEGDPLRPQWELAKGTKLEPEAYLSSTYVISNKSSGMMARQSANLFPISGMQFKISLDAKGWQDAQIGMLIRYETHDGGVSKLPAIWDQPLTEKFVLHEKTITFPPEAHRLLTVELHRSNRKGIVVCRQAGLTLLSDTYDGVKEAMDFRPGFCKPVGEPAPALAPTLWAMSLPDGPVGVLCITESRLQRHIEELAQRFEMNYDLVWLKNGTYYAYGAKTINAKLRREIKPYDVILVSAKIKDQDLIKSIEKNVGSGTGLIYLQGSDTASHDPNMLSLLPDLHPLETDQSQPLVRHVPWQYFPTVPDNYIVGPNPSEPAFKSVGVGDYKKGRVVTLNYGGPAGTYGGLLPHVGLNKTNLNNWWEYGYSLILKSVAYCANRTTTVQITHIEVNTPGKKIRVTVRGQSDFQGTLTLKWGNRSIHANKEMIAKHMTSSAGIATTVEFDIPDRVTRMHGLHVANLFLENNRKQSLDWATATLDVKSPVRLSVKSPFDRAWYQDGSPINATIRIHNDRRDSAPLTLMARLMDGLGRCVWEESREVSTTEIRFAPLMDRSLTAGHCLEVTLSGPEGVLDQKQWSFNLIGKWDPLLEDFQAGLHGDFYFRSPTDAVFVRWFKEMGFDFIVEQGVVDDSPKLNIPWYDSGIATEAFHHHKGDNDSIRNPCLSDPVVLERIVKNAVAAAGRSLEKGAVLLSMTDEAELIKDGRVEVCFSPHCSRRFCAWTQALYQDLDSLNAQWGTEYQSWDDIKPVTAQQARQRGNYAQWVDFRTFMEDVWVDAFMEIKHAIHDRYPKALVSLGNPFRLNPFSGSDHFKLAQAEDFFGKYMRPDLIKEYRSFNPSALMFTHWGYRENIPFCKWYPWYFAFHGGDIMNYVHILADRGDYDLFDGTYRHTARSLAVVESKKDLTHGMGKILHDFPSPQNEIAILYSQNSMKIAWIESDANVGREIWARRVMDKLPVSHPFALYTKSQSNFKSMIKESWLQPDFIAPKQIDAGKLADYRMLILPCSMALSEETLAAVTHFVNEGGTVVADMRTAMFNGHGKRMADRDSFETLFGIQREKDGYVSEEAVLSLRRTDPEGASISSSQITSLAREELLLTTAKAMGRYRSGTPAVTLNRLGEGNAIYLNLFTEPGAESQSLMNQLLIWASIRPQVNLTQQVGRPIGYECFRFKRGQAQYVGLLRDMAPQEGKKVMWFGPAFRQAFAEKENVHVTLPEPFHLYDVREGVYLGQSDTLDVTFGRGEAKVLAMLPYQVQGVQISGIRPTYTRGDRIDYHLTVQPGSSGTATDHVIRIEIYDPDGDLSDSYTKNVLVEQGKYQGAIPLALNQKIGVWKMKIIEMASKASDTAEFTVVDSMMR